MPNQEQEQDQKQNQEQKPSALRAVSTKTKNNAAISEQPANGTTSPLVALARKTLDIAGQHKDLEYLIDAFWHVRGSSEGCSRAEALEALNTALNERRLA